MASKTPARNRPSAGLVGTFFWFAGPAINEQFSQLLRTLPTSIDRIRETINSYSVGTYPLRYLRPPPPGSGSPALSLFTGVTGIASTLYGILTDLLLILVSALYFAANPQLYTRGILLLILWIKRLYVEDALGKAPPLIGPG